MDGFYYDQLRLNGLSTPIKVRSSVGAIPLIDVEVLERYHHFDGDSLKVECPTGSGTLMTLHEVARFTRTTVALRAILIGKPSSCSTNISTAKPVVAPALRIKRDGPRPS